MNKQITDTSADFFLIAALAVMCLNLVSQGAAFFPQVILVLYAVIKKDVRLLPGLFIALFDKSSFPSFNAPLLKFNLGFAVGIQNVFTIAVFLSVILGFLVNKGGRDATYQWIPPWILCAIPAAYISYAARYDHLSNWQFPLVGFMTPALYYWGIKIGKTWEHGRIYFIKRMILIFIVYSALDFFGGIKIFSFADKAISLALFVCSIRIPIGFFYKTVAAIGALFTCATVLLSRYISTAEKTGFSDNAELGSTFTTVATAVFSLLLAWNLGTSIKNRNAIRQLPIVILFCLTILFAYASARGSSGAAGVENDYRSLLERFEFKLVGDRGTVWADGLKDVFTPPYVFKRFSKMVAEKTDYKTGEKYYGMKMPPHNQVLTLLVQFGWWFGLFCVLFLLFMYLRMFRCLPDLLFDPVIPAVLVASSSSVFFAVGLTGQSVWTDQFLGNALATMIFPGIVYGVWLQRMKGYNYAHPMA